TSSPFRSDATDGSSLISHQILGAQRRVTHCELEHSTVFTKHRRTFAILLGVSQGQALRIHILAVGGPPIGGREFTLDQNVVAQASDSLRHASCVDVLTELAGCARVCAG